MAQKTNKANAVSGGTRQRKSIRPEVRFQLWVRAGARCHLCNSYLLESDELGYYPIARGEMAHNVGQSQDASSPRGNDVLLPELRNEVENLLLLCAEDHQTIDSRLGQGDFTVADLRAWKKDHEDHIKFVTGLPRNKHTCVVRLFGKIREQTAQLSRTECNLATMKHEHPRFARYDRDFHRHGAEIDLSVLGDPESKPAVFWTMVTSIIDDELNPILKGIQSKEIGHLSIFPFARIPALVYFGFRLSNKVSTTLFQRHRRAEQEWHWDTTAPDQTFQIQTVQEGSDPSKVALLLNVSGTISRHELPTSVTAEYSIFCIQPVEKNPDPSLVKSIRTLEAFKLCYRGLLAQLEVNHKLARQVLLFPSVPVTVAVSCGTELMPHTHPELIVFDRNAQNEFIYALSINAPA